MTLWQLPQECYLQSALEPGGCLLLTRDPVEVDLLGDEQALIHLHRHTACFSDASACETASATQDGMERQPVMLRCKVALTSRIPASHVRCMHADKSAPFPSQGILLAMTQLPGRQADAPSVAEHRTDCIF